MYSNEFISALKEKGLAGAFVSDYFTADKVLNSMQFHNGASNHQGGMSYTVVHKTGGGAGSRGLGENFTAKNMVATPETFYLQILGGSYSVDGLVDDINKKVFTINEAKAKMDDTVIEFSRQLIKGSGQGTEFLGLEGYCKKHNLTFKATAPRLTDDMTEADAIAFLSYFTRLKKKLNVDANVIYCSRDMSGKLEMVQNILNRYSKTVTIQKLDYESFLNIAIVPIDDSIMEAYNGVVGEGQDATKTYDDIYLARISTANGIYCGSPLNKSNFLIVTKPVENGESVHKGRVEFPTCLVVKNKKALIRGCVEVGIVE